MDNRPIGVFDSGVGGLTVVREIQKQLPGEDIVYIGDTARVPYGGRDPETLLAYGRELVKFLKDRGVKGIIVACGTSSSNGYPILCEENPELPIFDVITPGVEACAELSPKNAGFIATEATVRSGLFARLLNDRNPQITVHMRACPLFVPMAEEGWINNVVTQLVAENYLDDWRGRMDALVLGCTHFPLLRDVLSGVLPDAVIIDMAEYTVRSVKKVLEENGMLNDGSKKPVCKLYATGYADKFEQMLGLILGKGYKAEKA